MKQNKGESKRKEGGEERRERREELEEISGRRDIRGKREREKTGARREKRGT